MNNIGTDLLYFKSKSTIENRKLRYVEKVLTSDEVKFLNDKNLNRNFWKLWSLKESAYKYYLQVSDEAPRLNPTAYSLINWNASKAKMKLPNQQVIVLEIFEDEAVVFTCTVSEGFQHLSQATFPTNFPIQKITKKQWDKLVIQIKKSAYNIPYLKLKNKNYCLSKTHDAGKEVISVPDFMLLT